MTDAATAQLTVERHARRQGIMTHRFASAVPAQQTVRLEREAPADGRLTGMRYRIYPGPELALRINVYIEDGMAHRRHIPELIGREWIDGDDDDVVIELDEPLRVLDGDVMVVEVTNTSASNAYDYWVQLTASYRGRPGGE